MLADLSAARALAEQLRYAGDIQSGDFAGESQVGSLRSVLTQQALQLNGDVLPRLWPAWVTACRQLEVPLERASPYVFADPMPRADVYADSFEHCVIRFSSGLVSLLDAEEFTFVAAHELGHYLLGHSRLESVDDADDLEKFLLQRAAEISVDRLGLRACGSVEVCVRAMMKLMSGLGEAHVRFDVAVFISQLRAKEFEVSAGAADATHPSLVVRTRSLLWCAMLGVHLHPGGADIVEERARLDARVSADMQRFVDGPVLRSVAMAQSSVSMWMAAQRIARAGSFSKGDQERFRALFGDEMLAKFRSFASGHTPAQLVQAVDARLSDSVLQLRRMVPRSLERYLDESQTVARAFGSSS